MAISRLERLVFPSLLVLVCIGFPAFVALNWNRITQIVMQLEDTPATPPVTPFAILLPMAGLFGIVTLALNYWRLEKAEEDKNGES